MFNHWDVVLDFVKACVRMTVIWVFSTILAIVLDSWGIRAENLLLVYLVGVLISILATGSLAWAFCAAFVFTFTFNYLFTEPKLTFHMDDLNYVISSVIFVAVAATVATLVLKLQKQMQIANKKTEITAKLNEIGSGFLNLSGYQQIKEYSEASLAGLIGKHVTVLLKEDEGTEFSNSMAEWCYRQSIPCGHGECQFPDDNGLYVPIRNREKTYGVIIFDCAGWTLNQEEKIYVDTVISQITLVIEREQLSREKEDNRVQVERERLKSTLLRSISHDLRTPLTAIITYVNLLKEEKDEKKRQDYIQVLERKSLRLKVLIEDLFEISKASSKNVTLDIMDIDVANLFKQVKLELEDKIQGAGLEFRCSYPEEKLIAPLDSQKTYRIFENLLVNIIKYSMPNTRVYIEIVQEGQEAVVKMKNISAAELNFDSEEITERFVRGDSARNTEGSGLGLAIVKSFTELQGGKLKITTEADLFKVELRFRLK